MNPDIFVSPTWLAAHLSDSKVVPVDASWYMPAANRDAEADFLEAHVPGAVRFDLDAISDASSGLPHMLPDADAFAAAVGALGLREDMTIVIYDGSGLFSAPRVRWMFNIFGARDVRILEGGFPRWNAEKRPVEAGPDHRAQEQFRAVLRPGCVANVDDVKGALLSRVAAVVDARPSPRFRGEVPEPRAGLRSGHMPGAVNVPSDELIADGTLKQPDELAAIFRAHGVRPDGTIIASCGSGVTAAIVALALEVIGRSGTIIYDGSWSEWGGRQDCPVVTGK
ncbi:3-mercaptopyruvate sulfurtransferase [Caballeronia sp. dw_19]|uniref:3-mercaptopyruvate sulfurtransferase n=1 Tax=Caballeronia sp. dw_19 TaxID=2719791 RepID=UPI001BD242C9